MTSKTSSTNVQLELRIAQVAPDKSWVVLQIPGTATMAKVLTVDEKLGEWQNVPVGGIATVRISQKLAEHLKLYTIGGFSTGSKG